MSQNYSQQQFNGFGIENDLFYVDYASCGNVDTVKVECEKRAQELIKSNRPLLLGLSSGLDSQVVLHSFYSQGFKINCAFLHSPGYNDNELAQLLILEKKYGFKSIVVELNPMSIKDAVVEESIRLQIPPYQIIQKHFLERLPKDVDFIQGLEGPYIGYRNKQYCYMESFNSYEKARIRALSLVERSGKIISWERDRVLLSILQDTVTQGYITSANYFVNNGLVHKNTNEAPSIISHWDLYIKPILYGTHWKKELIYFPKYQGPEKIDYVMQGLQHDFTRMISLPVSTMITQLQSNTGNIRLYENDSYVSN